MEYDIARTFVVFLAQDAKAAHHGSHGFEHVITPPCLTRLPFPRFQSFFTDLPDDSVDAPEVDRFIHDSCANWFNGFSISSCLIKVDV